MNIFKVVKLLKREKDDRDIWYVEKNKHKYMTMGFYYEEDAIRICKNLNEISKN